VSVNARDPLTVEFSLEQNFAPFLSYLTLGILPEHLLGDLDPNGLYNAPFNANPVGTGPYRFAARDDDSVELASSATYYLGPPRITTLELRLFADDVSLQEALQAGSIDGGLVPASAPSSLVDLLRQDPRLETHDLVATEFALVLLDTRHPLFSEREVRRAMFRAIDIAAVVDEAAAGLGRPAGAGIPQPSWAYAELDVPDFSPGAAATLLEQAGWARGRDGVRQKDGVRFSFALSVNNLPQRVAIAESVARQWRAIGLDVDVQPLDSASFLEEHLLARQFQAAVFALDPGTDPDPYPFWHSSQAEAPGRNLSGYSTPLMDDALERARQNTGAERRRELYQVFAGLLIEDMPSLPLFFATRAYVQAGVHGFQAPLLSSTADRFLNVHQWYVKTRVQDE
jgi:peptide/nickel transport system substrate-binding protein